MWRYFSNKPINGLGKKVQEKTKNKEKQKMPERQTLKMTLALWKQNQEQKQMCCIFMYLKVHVIVTKPMSDTFLAKRHQIEERIKGEQTT